MVEEEKAETPDEEPEILEVVDVEPKETSGGKRPYVCSICEQYFESKAKKIPRHTCKEEFLGKTGFGIPGEGHPDFKEKEEPIPGDIDLTIEESEELSQIPFSGEPEEKPIKPKKPKPIRRRTAKADKERVSSMVVAMGALLSNTPLSPEEEAEIVLDLVADSVSLSVDAAEVHIGGLVWIGICAAIGIGFYVKRNLITKKIVAHQEALKKQGDRPGEEERW